MTLEDEPALAITNETCERCGHLMPEGCIGWCHDCNEAEGQGQRDFEAWGGWRRAFSEESEPSAVDRLAELA